MSVLRAIAKAQLAISSERAAREQTICAPRGHHRRILEVRPSPVAGVSLGKCADCGSTGPVDR